MLLIQCVRTAEGGPHRYICIEGTEGAVMYAVTQAPQEVEWTPGLTRAAMLLEEEKLEEAASALAVLPPEEARTPPAHLLRASLALETGQSAAAEDAARELRLSNPDLPEGLVLEKLLRVRHARQRLSWRESYVQAWTEAGCPSLATSALLVERQPEESSPTLREVWGRQLTHEQRFTLALSLRADASHMPVLLAGVPAGAPPELAAAAVDHLSREALGEEESARAWQRLRPEMERLARAHPDSMQLALLVRLGGTSLSAPFTVEEVAMLEEASRLPAWRLTSMGDLHGYALRQLTEAGLVGAQGHALWVTVAAMVGVVPHTLRQRVAASRAVLPEAVRRRLGEAVWRIGVALARESSLVEAGLGQGLMLEGARDAGDSARERAALAAREGLARASEAETRAAARRWPLPSLRRELHGAMLRDEVDVTASFLPTEAPRGL